MKRISKRLLSLALALLMVAALLPVSALPVLAEETWVEVDNLTDLETEIAKGGNIRLKADITADKPLSFSKAMVLDFNGKTLTLINTQYNPVEFKSTITLQDTSEDADGGLYINGKNNKNYQLIRNSGNLTIKSGVYKIDNFTGASPRVIYSWGTVTVEGGSFIMEGNAKLVSDATADKFKSISYGALNAAGGKMYINGGSFSVTNNGTGGAMAVCTETTNSGNATVIKGGTFSVKSAGAAYGFSCGRSDKCSSVISLTVPSDASDISVTAHSTGASAYGIYNAGTISLQSDKLSVIAKTDVKEAANFSAYAIWNGYKFTVSGGSYKAYVTDSSTTKAQANGFNNSSVSGNTGSGTISGGYFYGEAPSSRGSGIVTSYANDFTITGNTVAEGTGKACWLYRGTVLISGGTFTCSNTNYNIFADASANVTITGGTFKHAKQLTNTGTLTVTGGKFVGKSGEGMVDIYDFLDTAQYSQNNEGEVVAADTVDPRFAVTLNGETTQYESYLDMVDAVNADGTGTAKITLLRDVFLGHSKSFTASVEIDLNGNTWLNSNGNNISVDAVGSQNAITKIYNGAAVNKLSSVPIYVSAGAMQLENLTAYGCSTMPVCYSTLVDTYNADNYIKNCNLITNRFYTFSYRSQNEAGQQGVDMLIEDTNLINLYHKKEVDGTNIFYAGSAATTGQYTLGQNVNMYTVADIQALAVQSGMTAESTAVLPVAAEGYAIQDRQAAASYSDINAILANIAQITGFTEGQFVYNKDSVWTAAPTLYKWSTISATQANIEASIGDKDYDSVVDALNEAQEGDTVILKKHISDTTADLVVVEGVTLDLNGMNLTASTLTVYGALIDGANGGNALIKTRNRLFEGAGCYLPIYDSENDGYRIYNYQVVELGSKKVNDNTAKFGFRLTLRNASGYALMANANSGLSMKVQIACDGASTFEFAYPIQDTTVQKYAQAMAAGTTTTAITLTVTGLDVLGANGSITMTPVFSTGVGMSATGAGASWTATNN